MDSLREMFKGRPHQVWITSMLIGNARVYSIHALSKISKSNTVLHIRQENNFYMIFCAAIDKDSYSYSFNIY